MGKGGGKAGSGSKQHAGAAGSSSSPAAAAAATAAGGAALGSCSQVKLRHILCEKHAKISEALARLQAGEKFDAVAAQMSEDAARKGGDLGWKRRNELAAPIAEAAFKLGVGQVTAQPVKTQFGYHLILCEGRKA